MNKLKKLTILKETKSRTHHICTKCGVEILPKEIYYIEHVKDEFLQKLHAKKFCSKCYTEFGDSLLK